MDVYSALHSWVEIVENESKPKKHYNIMIHEHFSLITEVYQFELKILDVPQ